MKALGQWVERDGGGLLVAGGEAVFGEAADQRRRRAIATPSSSG